MKIAWTTLSIQHILSLIWPLHGESRQQQHKQNQKLFSVQETLTNFTSGLWR